MTSKTSKNAVKDDDGVFVYIGPTVRGIIQNGSIYRGTRKGVLAKLAFAINKYPKIERLLVRDTELAEAREKINNGVNSLSVAFRALQNAE